MPCPRVPTVALLLALGWAARTATAGTEGPAPGPAPAAPPRDGAPREALPQAPAAKDGPADGKGGEEKRFVRITVDRSVGRFAAYPVDDRTWAVVLLGTPRIESADLTVKASTIVVWLDREKSPDLAAFAGAAQDAAAGKSDAGGAAKASGAPRPRTPAGASKGRASVIPEALLGIYAEGGVDLVTGHQAFRAYEAYIDPQANRALLVEPRYDTSMPFQGSSTPVPIHVRARRARILAEGLASFDDAQVSTSRANDRIEMRVKTLTIEEYGQATQDEPLFLGFRGIGSQRFTGQEVLGVGERLPLFYAPEVAFGGENGLQDFPARLRRASFGARSSLGYYALVGLGGKVGQGDWLDWTVDAGGYTKRGPALGVEAAWKRPAVRGQAKAFGVWDFSGEDRDDYDAGQGPRGLLEVENRWEVAPRWRVDAELNLFSDRGVNREYFESDFRNHKDRETYGRVRYLDGGTAATLTAGAHARDFTTESFGQPEAALWSESVPLGPRRGPGTPSFDLSTEARGGRLLRRFDDPDHDEGYEAYRVDVTERVYAPFSLGDVRVSPFVGGRGTGYYDRTDGGNDVTVGTFEAGVRADLQLHRDFCAYGGPWALDGLRHVVDVDVGGVARVPDDYDPDDVAFFDRIEEETRHSEVNVELRSRLETRRAIGKERVNATLVDARLRVDLWPDEHGPYGRTGIGQAEGWLLAEVAPQKAWVGGSALAALESPEVGRASLATLYSPRDDLSLAVGVRYVHGEVLAPWFDTYWRWNEKWGARVGLIRDFEGRHGSSYRVALYRFSTDHLFEVGVAVKDDGNDASFFFDFLPAIEGKPLRDPFDPHEAVDYTP